MHRNTKVCISLLESYYNHCYSLCWGNSRISKVTQEHFGAQSSDGSDPHFPHTLKDVWHQLIHAPEEDQTTARWQVARTTTTDNAQLSPNTFICDLWHIKLQQVCGLEAEGRVRAHCQLHSKQWYFWENTEYPKLFFAELQKTKTLCI